MKEAVTPDSQNAVPSADLQAWMSLAFSVISSLATSAFRRNEADYQLFSQELLQALAHLKSDTSRVSVLRWAEKLSRTIEHYHQNSQNLVNASTSELQGIIHVLLSALDSMQLEYDGTASDLENIENKIDNTQTVEELVTAREDLTQALRKLAAAARTRKQENSRLISNLHERILILEKSCSPATQPAERSTEVRNGTAHPKDAPQVMLDPLTGLPNREAAENAIITLKESPAGTYLASFTSATCGNSTCVLAIRSAMKCSFFLHKELRMIYFAPAITYIGGGGQLSSPW